MRAPADTGFYILVVDLNEACEIKAGRLPKTALPAGCFLYIGRAKRYLSRRLKRHARHEKKNFWHIDYLLVYAQIQEIWLNYGLSDECHVAEKILSSCPEAFCPIPGFGSSDCRCLSHLICVPAEDETWRQTIEAMNFKKAVNHEYSS